MNRSHPRTPLLAARGETQRRPSLVLFAAGGVAKTCSTPSTAAFRLLPSDKKYFARSSTGFHHGLLAARTHTPSSAHPPNLGKGAFALQSNAERFGPAVVARGFEPRENYGVLRRRKRPAPSIRSHHADRSWSSR